MHNSLIEQRRRETKRFLKMRERVWRWEETRKGGVGVQFTPQNERGMGKKYSMLFVVDVSYTYNYFNYYGVVHKAISFHICFIISTICPPYSSLHQATP